MAEVPLPLHTFELRRESDLHHGESLFNLNLQDVHSYHASNSHSPAHGWRPTTIDEFNAWNTSPQGIFPTTLVGPGHNPDPLPHLQPRHPVPSGGVSDRNTVNSRKRKRTTPPNPAEAPPVGGYGPISPADTSSEPSSPTPSPPSLSSSRQHGRAACNVWAFAHPLESGQEPPVDQWPTPLVSYLTKKPKSPWFGCRLCSQSKYITCSLAHVSH